MNFNGCKSFLKERVATKYQYLCMGFESNDGSVIKDQKQPDFKPLILSSIRIPYILFQGASPETSFYNRCTTVPPRMNNVQQWYILPYLLLQTYIHSVLCMIPMLFFPYDLYPFILFK